MTPLSKSDLERGVAYDLAVTLPVRESARKYTCYRVGPLSLTEVLYCGRHEQTGRCLVCDRRVEGKPMVTFVDMRTGCELLISPHCWEYVDVYPAGSGLSYPPVPQTYEERIRITRFNGDDAE